MNGLFERSHGWVAVVLGIAAVHCGGSQPRHSHGMDPIPASAPGADGGNSTRSEPASPPTVPCPDPDDSASAQGSFERGKTLLDGSRVGEHYLAEPFSKGLALLRSAAAKGHVEAQYLYGSVRFSETFMQDAPGPADEGAYVSSLTYLRTAALRGHDKARDYIPGLATLQLDAKGHLQKPLPEPLDQVPADWVRRAVIDSDALAACP